MRTLEMPRENSQKNKDECKESGVMAKIQEKRKKS